MYIQDVIQYLEGIAPPRYQESYDNSGLLVGDAHAPVKGIITCLDVTEAVVDEAAGKDCNLIVAHHPILFKGLKRLTGSNYVARTVQKAIRNDLAIYAIHTNLDNVFHWGVNERIAQRLDLQHCRLLAPKAVQKKVEVFLPAAEPADLIRRLHAAGLHGRPAEHGQLRLEGLVDEARLNEIRQWIGGHALHSYSVDQASEQVGSGMVGELPEPMDEMDFLHFLKDRMQTQLVRHTRLLQRPVQRVALCGGSGSFLLPMAKSAGAQVFITGDYKYHDFFDAEDQILIADIGHYESEQFTIPLLRELLSEKFRNFAVHLTEVQTNPVHYLF